MLCVANTMQTKICPSISSGDGSRHAMQCEYSDCIGLYAHCVLSVQTIHLTLNCWLLVTIKPQRREAEALVQSTSTTINKNDKRFRKNKML